MSALPNISVKRITLTRASANTEANVVFSAFVKDKTTQDPSTAKGAKGAFYNSIKVLVLQIVNQNDIEALMSDTEGYIKKLSKASDMSETQHVACTVKDGSFQRQSKENIEFIYSSPKSFIFEDQNSYVAYAFIPFTGNIDSTGIVGDPTIEEVKVNNNIVKTAKVLRDPDGNVYNGPTHVHNNKIMAGAVHTETPHAILTESSVHNSTIHDLRTLQDIKKTKLNGNPIVKNLSKPYISDVFISRDPQNNCRYLFLLDFQKMVAEFSKIPILHSNLVISRKISEMSRITSMKIMRRRSPGTIKNSLFMPVAQQNSSNDVEIISISRDDGSGILEPNNYSRIYGEELRLVGHLKEVTLPAASPGKRAFSGTDVEMSEITDGIYQYGVELEVEDASERYATQILSSLKADLKFVKDYYNYSFKLNSYNKLTKQFKKAFRKQVNRNRLYRTVQRYVETLKIVKMNTKQSDLPDVSSIFSLICPINGTPQGIEMFIDVISDLVRALRELLKIQHNSSANKNYRLGGDAPEKLKTENTQSSRKFVKWFEYDFNSNLPKRAGYYFFQPTSAAVDGHVHISDGDYNSLVESQAYKLFGSQKTFLLSRDANNYTTINTDDTKYSFLSPISIGLGESKVEDFMEKNAQFYNIDKYNSIMAEMIKFNLGKSISNKDPSGTQTLTDFEQEGAYGRKLRENLVDVFSSLGCTVESISAFATPGSEARSYRTTSVVDKDDSSKVPPLDKNITSRQESTETLEDSNINPNNILNRIASALVSVNPPSPQSFNVFDFRDSAFSPATSETAINLLPNQIKALIAMYSGHSIDIDKGRLEGNHRDQFGFLYMNFMNIMKVEVLAGFGDNSLSKPRFVLLNANNLKRGLSLCRLVRYSSVSSNVVDTKIDYPVYYEYFLLESAGATSALSAPTSTEARVRQNQQANQAQIVTATTAATDINLALSEMTDSTNIYTSTPTNSSFGSAASAGQSSMVAGGSAMGSSGPAMSGPSFSGGSY